MNELERAEEGGLRSDEARHQAELDRANARDAFYKGVFKEYLAGCTSGENIDWVEYFTEEDGQALVKALQDPSPSLKNFRNALLDVFIRGAKDTAQKICEDRFGF